MTDSQIIADLRAEVEETRRTAEALTAANLTLTQSLSLPDVLTGLLDCLATVIPYDSASVMFLEGETSARVRALRGYEDFTDAVATGAVSFDIHENAILAKIIGERRSLSISDTEAHPGWQRVRGGEHVRSWLGVPLIHADRVLGLYSVDKAEPGFFTNKHRRFAESLSALAAVAIINANLYQAAEAASKAKSLFLGTMSHELRTPLNAIIGYAELLGMDAVEAGQSEHAQDLQKIVTSGHDLLGLIDDVLVLSRIQAGDTHTDRDDFDASALIDEVLGALQGDIERSGNRLEVVGQSALGTVHLDRPKVRQVVTNLLVNALKFTLHGEIRLILSQNPGELVVEVNDTGIGIAAADTPRLFDPFTQVDGSSTRRVGGAGVGLCISRHFCEMHGGSIGVVSEVGQGSTFTARFRLTSQLVTRIHDAVAV